MKNQISRMTNDELLDELVKYCPTDIKDVQRRNFSAAICRFRRLFQSIPHGKNSRSILDIGARLYTASIYCNLLDYNNVSLAAKWKTQFTGDDILDTIANSERIDIEYFDAETDIFPYSDNSYDVVICSEILEHLAVDPMHMMEQINRVTRMQGLVVMSTPNAASFSAIKRLLAGQHPYSWSAYNGKSTDRHNREYTTNELGNLIEASGFSILSDETFSEHPFSTKDRILSKHISLPDSLRGKPGIDLSRFGDTSLIVAKKTSAVRSRFPSWLYSKGKK